ncbi:transmembrane protein, putative (macronuclear) [Tetrahymena thermophila SB210]|uniref:Transmembrane protein, putative n=1 Tax=Tetrahymena thermophila (strain SB210) TaxID=312017 RepID=Q231Z9_TETTS|nr:transmembrane protein, putative [Tetrahymena thermophila SB210]EAR91301.1 transmembrane protein, putative [Tetrahymena thermophila SB210]|eukprot:XP_001011546.1 transmembrane protein, putative [Tetrahymena thermophila SB210]
MNKLLLLAIFLGLAGFCTATITCGTNAISPDGTNCYCQHGFYGTDASQGQTCQLCPNNTTTTSGTTNTGPSINVGACNQCISGFYVTAVANAASPGTAVQCQQCPANSNTSSAMTALGFCTCYDPNAAPLSSSVITCTCKSGYKGTPTTTAGSPSTCVANSVILSIFAALLSLVFLF